MDVQKKYYYLMNEISDPRVSNWPLMRDPFALSLILTSYLSFVLFVGPRYMRNRKPYSLHNVMIFYNVLIAVGSGIVFYGMITSGYTTKLSFGCEPVVVSYDPEALSMARWVWWLVVLKICELLDTVIFVLRKKDNQVSFLHVYHHVSTAGLSWIACKFAPGGMWTFNMLPNCLVHVVMYTYYLFAGLGPKMQKLVMPWKKFITILQMVQFVIMIVHTSQAFMPSCEPNKKPLACMYMFQVVFIFYLFYHFYKKTYREKKTE